MLIPDWKAFLGAGDKGKQTATSQGVKRKGKPARGRSGREPGNPAEVKEGSWGHLGEERMGRRPVRWRRGAQVGRERRP